MEGAITHDWAEAQTVWACVDALYAYAIDLFMIRGHDYSAWVLFKVLHDLRWFCTVGKGFKEQKKLLTDVVNAFFR